MAPADAFIPTAPFQAVATDYFQLQGKSYLLTVDRFSNWPDLREATAHTSNAGADGLIKANRELFATFGVPEHLSSDGGPEYTSGTFQAFLKTWGVKHRLASAYHPQSNGRAEVTVKAMKRLLRDNVDHNGKLDTDAVTRGILQLRNTPESDSGLSPAQIVLGRTLRDSLPLKPPFPRRTTVFDYDSAVSPVWKDVWSAEEPALKTRRARQGEKLEVGSHEPKPLHVGDTVRIQNQTGNHPTKWDKTGTIVQIGDNDQYIVMVDGSRRLTLRNRRYLRKLVPTMPSTHQQPPAALFTQLPAAPAPQPPAAPALQLPAAPALQPPVVEDPQPHAAEYPQPPATQHLQPPAAQSPQPPGNHPLRPPAAQRTPIQGVNIPMSPDIALIPRGIPSIGMSTPLSSHRPPMMDDTAGLGRSSPPAMPMNVRVDPPPNGAETLRRSQRAKNKPDRFGEWTE